LKIYTDPQGSDAWKESRRGVITGSRFKDARDKTAKGQPSAKCALYAKDVARQRAGGKVLETYQNGAMRFGTEQEPFARTAYELLTGNLVFEAGFITDDEGIFGVSVDGFIGDDGVLEIKTMVSSDTLFKALIEGDISEYIDQINGYLWLLNRQWVDLVLWAPDLADLGLQIKVIRINRVESDIEALEADLIAFSRVVRENESKLRLAAAANSSQVRLAA